MQRVLRVAAAVTLFAACSDSTGPVENELRHSSHMLHPPAFGVQPRPFKMAAAQLALAWGVERDQEVSCGGGHIAGGAIQGVAAFTHLGKSTFDLSAAWDIGNLLANPQFQPTSPHAGGPVAPVLSGSAYPYAFSFNPFTQQCGSAVSATGQLLLTAANGDELHGVVTGGETHRLDFVNPGDGIETFAIIEFTGGTGRFTDATGSFVTHTITRFDYNALRFVIDLAEVLPGGTLQY